MIPKKFREKCRKLRKRGFSLTKVIKITKLPKTTVYDQIKDISLPLKIREKLKKEGLKRLYKYTNQRKKKIIQHTKWNEDLIFIVAHFMFDGGLLKYSSVYYNRSEFQVMRLIRIVKKVFNLEAKIYSRRNNVIRVSFNSIEFSKYLKRKYRELISYLPKAKFEEKRIFLQCFFDDEGSIYYNGKIRRIRGYQHSMKILRLVKNLLNEFGIKSSINKSNTEIAFNRKENLIKFKEKINFSPDIFIIKRAREEQKLRFCSFERAQIRQGEYPL